VAGRGKKPNSVREPTPREVAEELVRDTAAALAGPFGPLVRKLWEAVRPGYERRHRSWLNDLAKEIDNLKERPEFQPDQLAKNEMFQTALWTAAQAAIRNHQEEKREYLRNAVLNSAVPGDLEESKQLVFLQLVDRLTALHIKVLVHFDNPGTYAKTRSPSEVDRQSLEQVCLDRFRGELDGVLLRIIISEAEREGLLQDRVTQHKYRSEEHSVRRTTDLGRDFVKYVTTKPSPD